MIDEFKDILSQNFETEDLGEIDIILNIKVVRESDGAITLS